MLKVIAVITLVVGLALLLVWLIDKFVSKKLKPFVTLLLWVLIIFIGYKTFRAVYDEIEFNKLKEERYAKVIKRLIDIREVELAHRKIKGSFSDNFDSLVQFVENEKFILTQRRDTTVIDEEENKRLGLTTMTKDIVIVDTLGYVPIKDSLFGADNRYKSMMNVPVGKPGAKFTLKAGMLDDIPVFEASVDKAIILDGENPDFIAKENQVVSVDGVNGPTIKVGSMEEVNTNGNWPKNYSKN